MESSSNCIVGPEKSEENQDSLVGENVTRNDPTEQQTVTSEGDAFVQSGHSPPTKKVTESGARKQEQKFELYTIDGLRKLPLPEWLIDGVIGLSTRTVLYGPPGEGKSFVALDMALSVASGRPWLSHQVKRKPIVYIVSEGGRGIRLRVEAWLKKHQVSAPLDAFFLLEAPQIHDKKDLSRLVKKIKPIQDLGLVVFDTLARSFVGGEENSAKEVGMWVEGAERILRETGATVLVVHHSGKPGKSGSSLERGSTSLRGAADTMIELGRKVGVITIKCSKQKDAEEFKSLKVKLDCFEVFVANTMKRFTSCVPVPADEKSEAAEGGGPHLSASEQKTLEALVALAGGANSASWKKETELAERTFQNHRRSLVEKGYVKKEVDGKRHWYAIAIQLPSARQGTRPPETAATATTPIGVAEVAEVARPEQQVEV